MFPALRSFLRAFLFDETAFLRGCRALIAAIALGGMGYAQEVATAFDAPGAVKWIKVASLVCIGLSLMLGAGDKTPEDVKALAATPEAKAAVEAAKP